MKTIFIVFTTLLMHVNVSLAEDFIVGEFYQGHINNINSTGITVSFPPGTWEATKNKKNKTSDKWWDHNGLFVRLVFKNDLDNAYLYITMPHTKMYGSLIGSLKPCKTFMQESEESGRGSIIASGVKRGRVEVVYCIQESYISGGTYLRPGKYLTISIEAKFELSSSGWVRYRLYYDSKNSNVSALSKKQLKEIGDSLINVLINNVKGKPGDYTLAEKLLKFNNTPISTSNSLLTVCKRATWYDGSSWKNSDTLLQQNKYDYPAEARSRNLSLEDCNKITGRGNSEGSNKVEEVSKDSSSVKSKLNDNSAIKNKLEELKELLDSGLISEQQYEDKSSKMLENF